MKNWTIGQRIALISGVLIVLLSIVGTAATLGLRTLGSNAKGMQVDAVPAITSMAEVCERLLYAQVQCVMALNAPTPEALNQCISEVNQQSAAAREALTKYEPTIYLEDDRANYNELTVIRGKYLETRTAYLKAITAGDKQLAQTELNTRFGPTFLAYRAQLAKMLDWNAKYAEGQAAQSVAEASRTLTIVLSVAIGSLLFGAVSLFMSIRDINGTLKGLASILSDSSTQVSAAAHQVSSASQTLAQGASQQAASLEETSASVEEITSMSRRNAENAASAQGLAREAGEVTTQGAQRMVALVSAMNAIKASSDNIAKVVKTIDEIAFQTNILALNAAVEAARAGEAGAGFAVVADEVRSLAQRAAAASRETASMIEEAIRTAGQGTSLTSEVETSLAAINDKASRVVGLVNEISAASLQQNEGLSQINSGVTQIDQVTQANASSAEETASAAEELSAQAMVLQDNVNQLLALVGARREEKAPVRAAAPGSKGSRAPFDEAALAPA